MAAVIYRDTEIILAVHGVPYVVRDEDPNYEAVLDALELGEDDDTLLDLLTTRGKYNALREQMFPEGLEIADDDTLTYKGNAVPADLSVYVTNCIDRGSAGPIINFIKRLYNNPSHETRMSLFRFIETNGMPILEDGRFLAYKVVRETYYDKHTGTMFNYPGATLELTWSDVDSDPTVTCSRGLHACSREYLPSFYGEGDRVVTLAVAPEDVGAVPHDYNGSKIRCRKYEVLKDITDRYVKEQADITLSVGEDEGVNGFDDSASYSRPYYY